MDDSHRFIYPDCGQPNFRLLFADHQLSFFSHFPGKHVTLIIYSLPQRGDTTALGPQGPSNLRTLRPEGRSILRTFFQIKNPCETI